MDNEDRANFKIKLSNFELFKQVTFQTEHGDLVTIPAGTEFPLAQVIDVKENQFMTDDIDESIFPISEFKGQCDPDEPPEWERFTICLFGTEEGDFITEPADITVALKASGYRLVLQKTDDSKED